MWPTTAAVLHGHKGEIFLAGTPERIHQTRLRAVLERGQVQMVNGVLVLGFFGSDFGHNKIPFPKLS
jgi:hypothetical protein